MLDNAVLGEPRGALGELDLEVPHVDGRGEAEDVDGEVADVEGGGPGVSVEDLLQQEKEAAAGVVKAAIGFEVENEASLGGLAKLEENRVPDDPPGSGRGGVEGKAIAEKPEGNAAPFAPDGVVKLVVAVSDPREPGNRLSEQQVVLASGPVLPRPGID